MSCRLGSTPEDSTVCRAPPTVPNGSLAPAPTDLAADHTHTWVRERDLVPAELISQPTTHTCVRVRDLVPAELISQPTTPITCVRAQVWSQPNSSLQPTTPPVSAREIWSHGWTFPSPVCPASLGVDRGPVSPPGGHLSCSRILVANRGEIAVRAFRAATELGAKTVAVFMRTQVRTSAQGGRVPTDRRRFHPVRATRTTTTSCVVAVECGRDLPGHGFVENPLLAEACAASGITFIGPPAEVHPDRQQGQAIARCPSTGLAHPQSAPATTDLDLLEAAADIGFPVFVKTREWRRAWHAPGGQPGDPARFPRAAQREAGASANRRSTWSRPSSARGIEGAGARRRRGHRLPPLRTRLVPCSVATESHRRSFAPNLDPDIRARMRADANPSAESIGYRNAGTVEFLLGRTDSTLHRDEPTASRSSTR